jgi:hypothetical protein
VDLPFIQASNILLAKAASRIQQIANPLQPVNFNIATIANRSFSVWFSMLIF